MEVSDGIAAAELLRNLIKDMIEARGKLSPPKGKNPQSTKGTSLDYVEARMLTLCFQVASFAAMLPKDSHGALREFFAAAESVKGLRPKTEPNSFERGVHDQLDIMRSLTLLLLDDAEKKARSAEP